MKRKKQNQCMYFIPKEILQNLFLTKKLAFSFGYEVTLNKGFSLVSAPQNQIKEINANLDNYDAFFSFRIQLF